MDKRFTDKDKMYARLYGASEETIQNRMGPIGKPKKKNK